MTMHAVASIAEYAFRSDHHAELATYLSANVEHDEATGCLLWSGSIDKGGYGTVGAPHAKRYGTRQAQRLVWLTEHGKLPPKGTALMHACGCPHCVNPQHLTPAEPSERHEGVGSTGSLRIGRHEITAQTAWAMQSIPAESWSPIRLCTIFGIPAEIIDAVRNVAPKVSRTVLPSGFIRFDLPPGVTVVEAETSPELDS